MMSDLNVPTCTIDPQKEGNDVGGRLGAPRTSTNSPRARADSKLVPISIFIDSRFDS
jgi:hypothetical protein